MVSEAIKRAGIEVTDIDAVAFTRGPGLLGSLLVGTTFAKGYALANHIQLIEVNTLQAHILANFIKEPGVESRHPSFPFLPLLVSGGKSQLIVVENMHEAIIERETFETVQMMMQGRTRSAVGGRIHPLARKVVCSCCGCIMEQTGRPPRADGTRIRYVRCRMHQRAPEVCGNKTCTNLTDLQNVVLQRIRAYVSDWFDPEKVKLPEQDDPVRQRNQAMREELRKLRGDVERRRKAMQELYLD